MEQKSWRDASARLDPFGSEAGPCKCGMTADEVSGGGLSLSYPTTTFEVDY